MRALVAFMQYSRGVAVAVAAALVARFGHVGNAHAPAAPGRPGALGQSCPVIILALLAQQFVEYCDCRRGAVGR